MTPRKRSSVNTYFLDGLIPLEKHEHQRPHTRLIDFDGSMRPLSGVGLLVLSMTNRLGRPLDRIRALTPGLEQAESEQKRVLLD